MRTIGSILLHLVAMILVIVSGLAMGVAMTTILDRYHITSMTPAETAILNWSRIEAKR